MNEPELLTPEELSKLPSNEWINGRWYYNPYEITKAQLAKDKSYYEAWKDRAVAEVLATMFSYADVQDKLAEAKKELIEAYNEYIKLLVDELNSMGGLAIVHGFQSSRVEAGERCRAKIQSIKEEAGL